MTTPVTGATISPREIARNGELPFRKKRKRLGAMSGLKWMTFHFETRLRQPMTTAAIYARYSSDKQRKASLEDQDHACRRRAEQEGWTVVKVYGDAAISGWVRCRSPRQTRPPWC